MSKIGESIKKENIFMVVRFRARGHRHGIRVAANGYKASFWSEENVPKLHCGDGCTTVSI